MKQYELIPNDGHKSFYKKAIVMVDENGDETLYSYSTPIITKCNDGSLKRLWSGWSATTGRHIGAFCGIGKQDFMKMEVK